MNKITEALIKRFESHRVIFWYDEKDEMGEQYTEVNITGVEKINVQGNEFQIKHTINKVTPEGKFLLYFNDIKPSPEDNWLLDMELAHHVFHTDQEAIWLQEMGLEYHLKELVTEHYQFFNDKKRRAKLVEYLGEGDESQDIRYKMLAVTFGTENINVENEFSVAEKVNEVVFSPTPNVANYSLGIIVPKILKQENGVKSSVVPNIRILTTGGVKTSPNNYTYKSFGASDLVTNQYLYVGHTNDPLNPTYDLNFGLPKEVFYTFIGTFFTDNNLYNRYHKNYILNISDRDAKFITKYLWVNSLDINKFSFRNRLFIDGSYYSVNRIENYTPLDETSTKYELIKLLYTDAFVPTSIAFVDNPTTGESTVTSRISNNVNSENTTAIGDYIISPSTARNVLVVGDYTQVPENVDGFVQLNGVYIPKVANGTAINEIGSGTYYCNEADGTILIKPTISNVDIYLPLNNLETVTYTIDGVLTTITYGKKITLKRIDSTANIVTIYPDGSDTIDGFSSYTLSTTDTLNLQYNLGNWIIL